MRIAFGEALRPVLKEMDAKTKGILYHAIQTGGEPKEEVLKDDEKLLELGKNADDERIIEALRRAYIDGWGIWDRLWGNYDNYGRCLNDMTQKVLPQAFNVAKPRFKHSEDTWNGIIERELWIREKFIEHFWNKLSDEEKKELIEAIKKDLWKHGIDPEKITQAIMTGHTTIFAIRQMLGFKFHEFLAIVANWIARALTGAGLSLATNALLQKIAALLFSEVVGWLIIIISIPSLFFPRNWKLLAFGIGIVALSRRELDAITNI